MQWMRMILCSVAACGLVLILLPVSLAAQVAPGVGEGVDAQVLQVAPGPSHHATVSSSDVLDHRSVSFGVLAGYHRKPLGLRIGQREYWSVKRVSSVAFSWALGIADRFQVGFVLPVILEQYGQGAAPLIADEDEAHRYYLTSSAVGDLRLHGKVRLLRMNDEQPDERGLGLALDLAFSTPTGDELNFAGENGVVFAPGLIVDFHRNPFSVSLNTGVRLRSGARPRLADSTVGNQLASAFGMTVHLLKERLLLGAESSLLAELDDFNRMGIEFRGAVGTRPGESKSVTLWLSGGGGMSNRNEPLLSIPQMRFTLGLTYAPGADDTGMDAFFM